MNTDEIRDKLLTTRGIRSNVYEDGENIGHILLIDYDDKSLGWIEDKVQDLPGVNILLRSSERSYHLWNLTVRTAERTLWEQVRCYDDYGHLARGVRQDFWVLRTAPKERPSQELYKPAPELETWAINRTEKPQSLHHWRYAKGVFDIPDVRPGFMNWIGDEGEDMDKDSIAVTLDEYVTMDEELKAELFD